MTFFGGKMIFFRIRNFGFGLMLATALSVSMWSTAGQAYTPEQEQACTGDAFRLCSAEIPDVARVTACMARNKSQLSPPCRAQFRPDPEPSAAAGEPTNIRPVARRPAAGKARKPAPRKPAPKKPAAKPAKKPAVT
jgi:hypothetical protein